MAVNSDVNLFHKAKGFAQGHNDLMIMVNFFKTEGPAFVVLEPFMADLIAADREYIGGYLQGIVASLFPLVHH